MPSKGHPNSVTPHTPICVILLCQKNRPAVDGTKPLKSLLRHPEGQPLLTKLTITEQYEPLHMYSKGHPKAVISHTPICVIPLWQKTNQL